MAKAAFILAILVLSLAAHSVMTTWFTRSAATNITMLAAGGSFTHQGLDVAVNATVRLVISVPSGQSSHGINITGPFNLVYFLPAGTTSEIIFTPSIAGYYNFSCSTACPGGASGTQGAIHAN